MELEKWKSKFLSKRDKIQIKLENKGLSKEEIIEYFSFDNMKNKEKEFCFMYKTNNKCHEIDNLNCYDCACPHFIVNKVIVDGVTSTCAINSKDSKIFMVDNLKHCSCLSCTIPHKKEHALKHYNYNIKDSISTLENLRFTQLFNIFSKLFKRGN